MENVVKGESSVNEAMLTGESKPVDKSEGDEVIGGSVNEKGSLTIEISKTGDDSFLSQVMNLVEKPSKVNPEHRIWPTGRLSG